MYIVTTIQKGQTPLIAIASYLQKSRIIAHGCCTCVNSVDRKSGDLHFTLYAFEHFHSHSGESLIGLALYAIVTVCFNTSTLVFHSGISFSGAVFNLVFHVIIIYVCNQFSTQYLQICVCLWYCVSLYC